LKIRFFHLLKKPKKKQKELRKIEVNQPLGVALKKFVEGLRYG
jgi:hypothetical protein